MQKSVDGRPCFSAPEGSVRCLSWNRWGWVALRWLVLVLSFSQVGCHEFADAFRDIFVTLIAAAAVAFVVGMIILAVIGLVLLVGFVISLAMMLFNLTNPSPKTVVGAGVCGIVFAGSGVLGGAGIIWSAVEQTTKVAAGAAATAPGAAPSDPMNGILFGIGWLVAHLLYASALAGSAYVGQQKLKQAAQQGRPV